MLYLLRISFLFCTFAFKIYVNAIVWDYLESLVKTNKRHLIKD